MGPQLAATLADIMAKLDTLNQNQETVQWETGKIGERPWTTYDWVTSIVAAGETSKTMHKTLMIDT